MCSLCGAPQEADDPPCEHYGHGRFEKTYVRRAEGSDPEPDATTQWVCTACERAHPKHSPPCSRCGNVDFERRAVSVDPTELSVGSVLGVADLPGLGRGAAARRSRTPPETRQAPTAWRSRGPPRPRVWASTSTRHRKGGCS